MKYIIKANASCLANADYFPVDDNNKDAMIKNLEETGWKWIECREIVKHDKQLEGVIKRCSLGSKAQRLNLQALFNYQV